MPIYEFRCPSCGARFESLVPAGTTAAECPECGNLTIGGDGQMWQLLITMGFAGPVLYVVFYLRFWWKYRRDPSPVAVAGAINVIMMLMFMTVYTALELPLIIVMTGLALWWRSARTQQPA